MRKAKKMGATGGVAPGKASKPFTSPANECVKYKDASFGMAISYLLALKDQVQEIQIKNTAQLQLVKVRDNQDKIHIQLL